MTALNACRSIVFGSFVFVPSENLSRVKTKAAGLFAGHCRLFTNIGKQWLLTIGLRSDFSDERRSELSKLMVSAAIDFAYARLFGRTGNVCSIKSIIWPFKWWMRRGKPKRIFHQTHN